MAVGEVIAEAIAEAVAEAAVEAVAAFKRVRFVAVHSF